MQKIKINEIVIGSNNKGKIREISDLLPKNYKILTPRKYKLKSPKENGKSFLRKFENFQNFAFVRVHIM